MQLMKALADQVPSIPLYFVLWPVAFVASLQGPSVGSVLATEADNVHEWFLR